MRTFTTLPQVASYIRRHHYLFARRFVKDALTVLGEMNAYMTKESAVTGTTFEAWQYIPETCEHLKTHITIEKAPSGAWCVTETIA